MLNVSVELVDVFRLLSSVFLRKCDFDLVAVDQAVVIETEVNLLLVQTM